MKKNCLTCKNFSAYTTKGIKSEGCCLEINADPLFLKDEKSFHPFRLFPKEVKSCSHYTETEAKSEANDGVQAKEGTVQEGKDGVLEEQGKLQEQVS